jgi:23S rRNA (guanine745-N1)-methyltransferase
MDFIYQCPVCLGKLEQAGQSFICIENHTFDIAREGYVNLLLANQKSSKNPGDNAVMAESRKRFLEQGYYDQLSDEINKLVRAEMTASNLVEPNILDLGCGIGFYVGRLREAVSEARLWGIDISKPVIQKAAKRYPRVNFAIGSDFHLPYLDSSVDLIFSIFSPFDNNELLRVLKPGGKLLLVRPGPGHLKELATLIYGKFELQGSDFNFPEDGKMVLLDKYQLTDKILIKNNEDLINLVSMTPYFWRLTEENKTLLAKTEQLETSVDFQISIFQRVSIPSISA